MSAEGSDKASGSDSLPWDLPGFGQNTPLKFEEHKDLIEKLPVEDAVWYIKLDNQFAEAETEGEGEGTTTPISMMAVVDGEGKFIRTSALPEEKVVGGEEAVLRRMEGLLVEAMMSPMWGAPRKPRLLDGDRNLPLEKLDPAKWGLILCERASGFPPASYFTSASDTEVPLRACMECHKRGTRGMFKFCPKCSAVLFCTPLCLLRNSNSSKGVHAHDLWCSRMAKYASNSLILMMMPFNFMMETCSEEFDDKKYRRFLARHGVLGKGLWKREVNTGPREPPLPPYGEIKLSSTESPFVLPEETQQLQLQRARPPPEVLEWEDYYTWRGYPHHSPICILMQYALTLHYVLNVLLPRDFPNKPQLTTNPEKVTIHILGAEKEADLIPVFMELGALLPNHQLDIHMLGPNLSKRVHGKVYTHDNVHIQLRRKYYHRSELATQNPMLAMCFNAGIGAYQSWRETLKILQREDTPTYLTDYCHYSADLTQVVMDDLQLGAISQVEINPFRSPVRKYCEEHVMPWYSNGFLFHLKFIKDFPLD